MDSFIELFAVSPLVLVVLFFVAILAGFIDSLAGGGGLLTVPALMAAGMPPAQALAPKVGAFQYPSNRNVTIEARVVDPATSVLLTYDHRRFGTTETRRRLLARWFNEVNSPANER